MAKTTAPKAAPKPPFGDAPNPPPRAPQALPASRDGDTVAVPFLPQPYAKAPSVDPYLRPETVTLQPVTVCGYDLPPIRRGIQPGLDLDGKPVDRTVSVIWASRRQIDGMARAMARQHPDLAQGLEIVRAFMCDMDTMRDAVVGQVVSAMGDLERGKPERAAEALGVAREVLGRWNDERRLGLS